MSADMLPNVGNDLLRIHRVVTHALEISLQNIRGSDMPEVHRNGFIAYVKALIILLHSHHAGEDELSFPFWQTRLPDGPFEELGAQHREMIVHLERIEKWLDADKVAWNTDALNGLYGTMTGLQSFWLKHIALEEATISPENAREYLTPVENEALAQQLAEHGQAHAQPVELVMHFVVYNLSGADRAAYFRLLPPVMHQQLIPNTWRSVWKPMIPFLLPE